MAADIEVFHIEVDVAIARPPSPENIRTVGVIIATDKGINDATLGAISLVRNTRKVVMPTATRVHPGGDLMSTHVCFPQYELGTGRILCADCDREIPMTGDEWAAYVRKRIAETA